MNGYVFSHGVRMVRYWWQGHYDSDKIVYNNVFSYLRCDSGAGNLAKMPVAFCDGGGAIHKELLRALAPSLSEQFDMIVIPEGDQDTLSDLLSFIYSGR